ncbi:MAG: acetolactate synthase [Cereibacter sphaeroides]|uniref:Acetolactate synthase n=1 Tax=Cereibacter sphaeroides TaxID=1063 RepID=A0A2W5UCN0_CERSP|nr:MAG: acetolactate synthase [Cereibacter sphaeroides]
MAGSDEKIAVPSGQVLTLQDVVWNAPGPAGLTMRFRFVAPGIAEEGGTVDFDTAATDMAWLCQNFALPRISNTGPRPEQIIISLADRALEFGQAAPEATQFFSAYSLVDGVCVEEPF